jgi:predicted AlkP superfamily pyrophosphatase or phosphodiesterase
MHARKTYNPKDVAAIIKAIKNKPYIGEILRKQEMKKRGVMEGFADLVISPKVPYSLKTTYDKAYVARGQHDSLEEETQHVFALMWGMGVRKGFIYPNRVNIIDFAPTMAQLLEIKKPANATGIVLRKALR